MYSVIDFTKEQNFNFFDQDNKKLDYLGKLSKVNIFVGENNCGKSRLLRKLIIGNCHYLSNWRLGDDKKQRINGYISNINSIIRNYNWNSNARINPIDFKIEDNEFVYKIVEFKKYINDTTINQSPIKTSILNSTNSIISELSINDYNNSNQINKKVYIPILRGIENFNNYFTINQRNILDSIMMNQSQRNELNQYMENSKSIYANKIIGDYKIDKKIVFTGEDLYNEFVSKLLGDEHERKFVEDFQKFISKEFYNNKTFTILPREKEKCLYVKIGESKEQAIFNLGDGVKQLITILYKIFENKDKEMTFYIEEPEVNLHPGFQRRLIEIFVSNRFPLHTYFITTHSNHLVDNAFNNDNISIYKFVNCNEEKSYFKVISSNSGDVDILNQLGVNSSSVFLSNCTIWVEGLSDKIYLSKYIKLYLQKLNNEKFKEDTHYSFVEYAGNCIEHWNFDEIDDEYKIKTAALTKNIFIILDNDGNKKMDRKNKLKEILGNQVYILKSREIENLLTKNILEKTLKEDNKLEELTMNKYKNGYTEEKYANPNTKMGSFIETVYSLNKSYKGQYGVLKNKIPFAKIATSQMESWEDLSEEAKNLTKEIYKFIQESNK